MVCDTCDKSFKYKSWLAQHVKLSHQERRFNCDPCSKKFARPSHLKDHLKSKEHKRNATLLSDDQAQATSEDPEELSGLASNPHFSVNFSIFLSVTSSSMANSIHRSLPAESSTHRNGAWWLMGELPCPCPHLHCCRKKLL